MYTRQSSMRPHNEREPYGVAFSPDGRWLAAGSDDGTVRVWHADSGRDAFNFPGHAAQVRGVAFDRAGRWLASCGEDEAVMVWDLAARRQDKPLTGHAGPVRSVAFTSDGRRLVSVGTDNTARVWDRSTGQTVLILRGHAGSVWGVAFSNDDQWLATAGTEPSVKLWDGRPWDPDSAAEREAVGLLAFLFARPLAKADVVAYLRDSAILSPRARGIALNLVSRYNEEPDAEVYCRASRVIVRKPYLGAFPYRFALLQAEHACRLAPEKGEYRAALGAAQYRAGRYREAERTLSQAARLTETVPADLVFLAMAQHRLGQSEAAKATLIVLREMMRQAPWSADPEALGLMREAQTLLSAARPELPSDVFARPHRP
jgi:hypothetical protein